MSKKKMTIETIVNMDIREEGNDKLLRVALSKLKWLEKYKPEEITLEHLEKLYKLLHRKYGGYIGYIQNGGDSSWAISVKETIRKKDKDKADDTKWIYTVYAITLFEGLAKTILVLYGYYIKEIPFSYNLNQYMERKNNKNEK